MIAGFILYVSYRIFGGYYYALSIFSISLVLSVSALAKYLLSVLIPGSLDSDIYRGIFQLSIFLFIPLFAILSKKKYKFKLLSKDDLKVESIPQWVCLISLGIVLLVDFILFGYLIVA